jgi:hypothetical protein
VDTRPTDADGLGNLRDPQHLARWVAVRPLAGNLLFLAPLIVQAARIARLKAAHGKL